MRYTIKKGRHRARPIWPRFWRGKKGKTVRIYKITLHEDCWYSQDQVVNSGVNKAFGLSFFLHGERFWGKIPFLRKYINSAMVGWKSSLQPGRFMLYSYTDKAGKETRDPTGLNAEVEVPFLVKFTIMRRILQVSIGENIIYQGQKPNIGFGYILKPYFGGDDKAYHTMHVTVERIK